MTTYADPTRCPDCHAVLPRDPQVCRVCSLPLTGETAVSLFRTLQEADRLVGALRAQKQPVTVAAGAPTVAAGSRLEGVESYPAPARPVVPGASPRVSALSVPRILLSLGALCLLVAAVIFLAFAWSWLGVGGRTVVLVALTGASLGLSVALLRRGLRMAAEALSIVGLGLLAIDVVGGRHAGWLGTIDDAQLTLMAGTVVATGALALLVLSARRPLIAPALVAPVAVLVATVGAQSDTHSPVPVVIALVVLLGLGRVGNALPSGALASSSVVVGVVTWLGLVVVGADHAGDPLTVSHFWGDVAAWPLLAAVAIALLVGPATGLGRGITTTGYAVGAVLGSYVVVAPTLDNNPDAPVVALVVAAAVWSAVFLAAPGRWRVAPAVALAGVVPWPLVAALRLLEDSGRALTTVGDPFTQSFGVHLFPTPHDVSPWLLPVALVVLGAGACALTSLVVPVSRVGWTSGVGAAALIATLATPALYDVPLALPLGLALALAVAAFLVAERLPEAHAAVARALATVLVTGTAFLALPSNGLTTVALVIATGASALLMLRGDLTGNVALVAFPLAFAGLVWAAADVAQVDEQYRAIPVLLVLGGLALWRPRVELELSAALAGAAAAAGSIAYAPDPSVALAVYLTVAGVLVTASSIVHPSRRLLAWPGGLLLAAATWVRLIDLGVHVPEAYTLPSALALIAVGGWRLRRDDRSATLAVLAPGLTLATVPSLVAMLDDPYSLRALLLGVACLALTITGATLRWSAPLVVGATVGGLLVLRELAPYAAHVPTWVSIGASGALLLAVGITWESRMNDARRASRYVAALR
jgi:hypothetical protein